jgi:HlyD family secretion protein
MKKKIIWSLVIIVAIGIIGYRIFGGNNAAGNIQTDTVKKQDLKQTVLTTGQVVSRTDLDLAFKSGGFVKKVLAKEGDKVKAGDLLATLDQTDVLASLTSAQGGLAQAKANYDKVLAGASDEAITVTQKAVDAAQVNLQNSQSNLIIVKAQQDTAVQNSHMALLNTTITAVPSSGNPDAIVPVISGTYTGSAEGEYQITIYTSGNGVGFQVRGLGAYTGDVRTTPVAMGDSGLFIQFSSNPSAADTWTATIPNTNAATYVTNNNAYQAALRTRDAAISTATAQVSSAQVALAQAQASLGQQRAQARPADISVAKAQILSAQGQVQMAQASVENTVIRAPANGTITQVDIKVGEQASPMKEVLVLQDVGDLHVESNVSEASIASLQAGQSVDITFDALGPDSHFTGTLKTINPASTVISGVVDYKVTASFDAIPGVKPGMTANMTILAAKKDGVLALPQRAVIDENGKKYVRVVDDTKKKTYHKVEVVTGLSADGGLVELASGLSEGQEIVTYIKP